MKYIFYFIIVISSLCSKGFAQQSTDEINNNLIHLYQRLSSAKDDPSRLAINDSIRELIESYVKSEDVFSQNLEDLRYLGQITSPDSLLKIITWNLPLDNYNGVFYSYILRRKLNGPVLVYPLSAGYSNKSILQDTTYTRANWYGALYYDIRPFFVGGTSSWVVLGLNTGDPRITRKMIDVISFTDDDSISFGKKVFLKERHLHRVVFNYASSGMMSLRFMTDKSIVFDHLVPVGATPDNRPLYGSDFSFDSYTNYDGVWTFSENIDVRNNE